MNESLTQILHQLGHDLRLLYGDRLVQIVLYGSQARGDAKPDSDIDVLVVLQGALNYGAEIERTSELISELSLQHQTVISRAFASAERFQNEKSPFLINKIFCKNGSGSTRISSPFN